MENVDTREGTLPRWAQQLLRNCRNDVESARRQVRYLEGVVTEHAATIAGLQAESGPADSNVFIEREDPDSGEPVEPLGLGRGPVRFVLPGAAENFVYVAVEPDGRLSVTGLGGLIVRPVSPTRIVIETED